MPSQLMGDIRKKEGVAGLKEKARRDPRGVVTFEVGCGGWLGSAASDGGAVVCGVCVREGGGRGEGGGRVAVCRHTGDSGWRLQRGRISTALRRRKA